jgi:hypothetical protein
MPENDSHLRRTLWRFGVQERANVSAVFRVLDMNLTEI